MVTLLRLIVYSWCHKNKDIKPNEKQTLAEVVADNRGGKLTFDEYLTNVVLAANAEADNVVRMATARALGVKVVCVDLGDDKAVRLRG